MFSNKQLGTFLYLFSTLFGVVWLTYFMVKNPVPLDSGDGLMHFFIAQATWEDPMYFIHHWGKPLFSLLASPFAQVGLNGVVTFNIVVFATTCVIGHRLMNKLATPIGLQFLFPLILLIPNDYSMTILAGLTEPLFNLLVILAGLLLVNKKWMWFAIVLSLLPFARSEGQLPLILGLILLIWNKQFKFIPFLGLGLFIYGIVGWTLGENFWWYFTDSPYDMANGVYGKGTWNHYLLSYRNYIGNPGLYVLLLGVPMSLYFVIRRKWEYAQVELTFFSHGVFLGIVILHSYFWATGQNGSLGLTRIATQGMPLFLLVNLSYVGRFHWMKHKIALILLFIGGVFMAKSLLNTTKYPNEMTAIEANLEKAKVWLLPYLKSGKKVYYSYPYFGYAMNENLCIKNDGSLSEHYYLLDLKRKYNSGDFILWDSHFGPAEAGAPIEMIDQHKEFVLVKEYVFGRESIRIYQYVPISQQLPREKSDWNSLADKSVKVTGNDEFINLLPDLPADSCLRELELVYYSSSEKVQIVFDNGQFQDYSTNTIEPTDSLLLKYQLPAIGESKLYIWNPQKVEATVSIKNFRYRKVEYPRVI